MADITIKALCAICKRETLYQNIHYKKELNKLLAKIKDEFDVMRYFCKQCLNKIWYIHSVSMHYKEIYTLRNNVYQKKDIE